MTQFSIFIDGGAGTTGLQVKDRLLARPELSVMILDDDLRKNDAARKTAMHDADVTILCLPDNAALQAAEMSTGTNARLIDASTAHRVAPNWIYGFAELTEYQAETIANAARVSNPGCYPTGFLALVRPLVEAGIIAPEMALTIPSVSGYSGGGNALIAAYENTNCALPYGTYGLTLQHKHLPEMTQHAQLTTPPIFMPSVGNFPQGMLVSVPFHAASLQTSVSAAALTDILQQRYASSPLISVAPDAPLTAAGFLAADHLAASDRMELFVFADETSSQFVLTARLDNLGKGAAGAAVQNMNLMLGLNPYEGLNL